MQFRQLTEEVFDNHAVGVNTIIESEPGIGKSDWSRQLRAVMAKRFMCSVSDIGFQTMFLATYTPPDLLGYQFKCERVFNNGKTLAVTEPSLPLWMMTEDGRPSWEYKYGILVMEEYGQGEADVKRGSAELLLNKQIGPWTLGGENKDGWMVLGLTNTSEHRSGVTKNFDFVINRVDIQKADTSVSEWTEDYAEKNNVDPLTIYFANQYPEIVFSGKVPDKQGPYCTPRSLVRLDRKLQLKKKRNGGVLPTNITEACAGYIGQAAAAQYMAAIKLQQEMPKYEDIIANPKKVRVPDAPDACMLICYNLAHRVTEEELPHVVTYMERMNKDFSVTFATSACRRNRKLATTEVMRKWAKENGSLMAAIAAAGQ
jgi:hypothetical protein